MTGLVRDKERGEFVSYQCDKDKHHGFMMLTNMEPEKRLTCTAKGCTGWLHILEPTSPEQHYGPPNRLWKKITKHWRRHDR